MRHNGADLPYRLFDKDRRVDQAAVVENKFFGPLLAITEIDGGSHVVMISQPAAVTDVILTALKAVSA